MLSELERDALSELVNIAVSGAAVRLREMVGSHVLLSAPRVELLPAAEATRRLREDGLARFVAVRQSFVGRLAGEALLVIPLENKNDLIAAVVGGELDAAEQEAIADDALQEIGNVLLVGFLSGLGNLLDVSFEVGTPVLFAGAPEDVFGDAGERAVLFVHVDFGVDGRQIRGYFALFLNIADLARLRLVLADYIAEVSGG